MAFGKEYIHLAGKRDTHPNRSEHTLAFTLPVEEYEPYRNESFVPLFDVETILVEDERGYGRPEFSIWSLSDVDNGPTRWVLEDNEPGILTTLYDDSDEPCADCLPLLPSEAYTFDHDDFDADDSGYGCCIDPTTQEWPDGWESFYCCDAMRTAFYDAQQRHNKDHPDDFVSLSPDYYVLDGGDALCRRHLEAWFGPIVTIGPYADALGTRSNLLATYFDGRRRLGNELPDTPDPIALHRLARLWQTRKRLERVDNLRRQRDEILETLRDQVDQTTLADWSGLTQQRVAQIQRDAQERQRALLERLETSMQRERDADNNDDT